VPTKSVFTQSKSIGHVTLHIGFGPECALLDLCATTIDEPVPTVSIHLVWCLEYGCGWLERFVFLNTFLHLLPSPASPARSWENFLCTM